MAQLYQSIWTYFMRFANNKNSFHLRNMFIYYRMKKADVTE